MNKSIYQTYLDMTNDFYFKLSDMKSYIVFRLKMIDDKNLSNRISKNLNYKNKYKNKRCFILGNGPSLNDVNFSDLEDEYVFTVNQIARHDNFDKLKTNFHIIADPQFHRLDLNDNKDLEVAKNLSKINTENNKPTCFISYEAVEFCEDNDIFNDLNFCYFYAKRTLPRNYKHNIDYTKNSFAYINVVLLAISYAIFMGFSEIYLLGCDCTVMNDAVKLRIGEQCDNYAYDVSYNENKRLKEHILKYEIEHQFRSTVEMFNSYKKLNNYCKRKNIKLINCSSTTILDSVPRRPLDEVLGTKKATPKE